MKPLLLESHDNQALQELGKASVQVIHDLKNQINGLKLYATFLRKRMEKSERPTDELETVNKLIRGLDRTAVDLSMIVQFGHPVDLKPQSGIDLYAMMQSVVTSLNESRETDPLRAVVVIDSDPQPLLGEFDAVALSEALKSISLGAGRLPGRNPAQEMRIHLDAQTTNSGRKAIIEWRGFDTTGHDPFNSFVGSDGLRMALAAKVVGAHGGSAERKNGTLRVQLPLAPGSE